MKKAKGKSAARNVPKSAPKEAGAGASTAQVPNPEPNRQPGASTGRSRGVSKRGQAYHLEMRTGSYGCRKIHAAHFGQNRKLVLMSHDVGRMCLHGVTYLELPKNKLNFWEDRDDLHARFRDDPRMAKLAEAHLKKDEDGENWDAYMKTMLRELASDALKHIESKVQEEAAAPLQLAEVDSQNNSGNLSLSGFSDDGYYFDIDGTLGLEAGDNWPNKRASLREISPEPPEHDFWYEGTYLEAENTTVKAELAGQRFPDGEIEL